MPKPIDIGCAEPADFEGVYRSHIGFVWRVLKRCGVLPSFQDDLAQEVFLVVHRRLGEYEGRSTMKTWLYGIVRRVVADHRRSIRRKPTAAASAREVAFDSGTHMPGISSDTFEMAEKVRLLYRVLDELDEPKREIFVLSELEGMTLAEVAQALNANPNTVASRVVAARRAFETALERITDEDERRAQ